MDFEAYLAQLPTPKPLSEVKLKILRRLWHQDMAPFPKPWVSSSELLELTQQSYFDRRARELRELGCDIESHYHEAFKEHAWRLNSSQLSTPKHRDYLTKSQKQHLFEQHNFTCAICGQSATPGLRGLQADHKRPLSRGGTHEIQNWQPLCTHCNIGKRRACQGCELSCQDCPWAFPETIGIPLLIALSPVLISRIDRHSRQIHRTRDQIIAAAVEQYLNDSAAPD